MRAEFHPLIENRRPQLRHVSVALRTRIFFGGSSAQMAWLFLGFGLLFVWSAVFHSEAVTWYRFLGHLERTQGTVVRVYSTHYSEGGSGKPSTPIYGVRYLFTPAGGLSQWGVGYRLGTPPPVGTRVSVAYRPGHPATSRVVGLRSAPLNAWVVLVVIFPGFGLGLLIAHGLAGRKVYYLLQRGAPVTGVLTAMRPTRVRWNRQRVWEATFDFYTPDGEVHTVKKRTNDPDLRWLDWASDTRKYAALIQALGKVPFFGVQMQETLTRAAAAVTYRSEAAKADPPEAPVIYDPGRPAYAVVIDDLGKSIILEEGEVLDDTSWWVFRLLVLPCLAIVGHSTYLVGVLVRAIR